MTFLGLSPSYYSGLYITLGHFRIFPYQYCDQQLNALSLLSYALGLSIEGVRNKSPQNVPLWCMDYFELKVKTLLPQEKLFPFPKYLEGPKVGIFSSI